MSILLEIADWIKVIGSFASLGLAVYFIVKALINRSIAKKPIRDQKKRDKAYKELKILAHDLGITLDFDKKDDKKDK